MVVSLCLRGHIHYSVLAHLRITRPLRLLQGATMSETVPATELPEYAPMALEDVAKVRTNPGHI